MNVTRMMKEEPLPQLPDSWEYATALRQIHLTDVQRAMLLAHYKAPGHKVTARELAEAAGAGKWQAVNSQYGRLGTNLRDALEYYGEGQQSSVIASLFAPGHQGNSEWLWEMHPQVAEALELLGWVESGERLLPEEVSSPLFLVEGEVCRVLVNAYERNAEARRLCIEHYGDRCCVCGFDFAKVYGEVAAGYIHVHHVKPLSEIGQQYTVDPIADLRPVCPNCHAVLHRRVPAYDIEEVRALMLKSV